MAIVVKQIRQVLRGQGGLRDLKSESVGASFGKNVHIRTLHVHNRTVHIRTLHVHIRTRFDSKVTGNLKVAAGHEFSNHGHQNGVLRTRELGPLTWSTSNMMTNFKEGYPSTRRSSGKMIFKSTFTLFCTSLELLSYDITYVI